MYQENLATLLKWRRQWQKSLHYKWHFKDRFTRKMIHLLHDSHCAWQK
jgi:hypothetical protein